ncbi:hypothetical protein H8A97_30525 [Bradyrhizobium sp. Arg62]|uniref:hypothetical protein n=1 Tax=Bradyrhizobium brasilense TaxID=1419277 RepID=UPI001E5CAA2E|nr:hypothetical protein [Bradyrhizobium brasilense]MCC8949322.1 hypothetical protein [Bradyrhizobium brasilense]
MTADLFGQSTDQQKLEVHEHTIISGPRANRGLSIVHSHEGGSEPHQHPHTGPASYTIDRDEWLKATGMCGGGRKRFTKTPEGEQLPIDDLEDWQKTFEIHVGPPPPGFEGTGGGMVTATRMILAHRMTVSNVIPFPDKSKKAR